jgi:hypothetical protein
VGGGRGQARHGAFDRGHGNLWHPWVVVDTLPDFTATPKNCNPNKWQSFTGNGILVLLADGSTRFVAKTITAATWSNAVHPDDGNVLGADW